MPEDKRNAELLCRSNFVQTASQVAKCKISQEMYAQHACTRLTQAVFQGLEQRTTRGQKSRSRLRWFTSANFCTSGCTQQHQLQRIRPEERNIDKHTEVSHCHGESARQTGNVIFAEQHIDRSWFDANEFILNLIAPSSVSPAPHHTNWTGKETTSNLQTTLFQKRSNIHRQQIREVSLNQHKEWWLLDNSISSNTCSYQIYLCRQLRMYRAVFQVCDSSRVFVHVPRPKRWSEISDPQKQ